MADEMITVFGCQRDEQRLFARYAARYGVKIRCTEDSLGLTNALGVVPGSAISITHKAPIDSRLLRMLQWRGVRYLSSRSVGLDHIDREAAKAAGIWVENVTYSPESVAEYTIMLMLMALRSAHSMLRRVENKDFCLEKTRARELRDMTVGVIGTGRIGKAVAERLSGFGCPILSHDPLPSANLNYVGLGELLERSDIVTLHVPLTDETRHLLDKARIAQMRKEAILINTARGALVDTLSLMDALEQGRIVCAALDVIEGEDGWFYKDCSALPPPPFARLLTLPNAIVTPHTAFYTKHALIDVVQNTLEGFKRYREGVRRWVV